MRYNRMTMVTQTNDNREERMSRTAEQALIAKIRGGCPEAARELVEEHRERLFAFVWRILRDHHDAEEVCQDSFLRAFASLDTFRSEYRFSTWLFTIGYRLALNAIRRKPMLTGEMDFTRMASAEESAGDAVAQSEEAEHLKQTVWSAVDTLSMPQRATLLLFYREEQSCQEIAAVLDMPVATVKSHLHRARARLRTVLSQQVGDESVALRWLETRAG